MPDRDAAGRFTTSPLSAMDRWMQRRASKGRVEFGPPPDEEPPAKPAAGSFDGGARGGPPRPPVDMERLLRAATGHPQGGNA